MTPMLLVILDGLTDEPSPLGTPLETAACPALGRIRRDGAYGTLLTAPAGLPVDSLTCISTLLGVPRDRIPVGRAYLEALSCGVPVGKADAVCRCNLVTVEDGRLVSSCAGDWDRAQMQCYYRSVFPRIERESGFRLFPMGGYKNLLVAQSGTQGLKGLVAVPPHERIGQKVDSLLPHGTPLAAQLAGLARRSRAVDAGKTVREHMLFPWDATAPQSFPNFASLHGLRAAAVCATEIVRGIAIAMGLRVVTPDGATGEADTDLAAKATAALQLLSEYDLVLVHVNGADELSHRRDAAGKTAFLSRVDRDLIAPLLWHAPPKTRMLVCSDHATSVRTGKHLALPQPFWLWGAQIRGALGPFAGDRAVQLLKGMIEWPRQL
ncbi:hypothetical protein H8711_03800 [Clostridiaceae bacterium NSJ-31]|uniref:Metalloenzyme domain-containing protein n=2 Tax=Ligaoa zhengdingensis TaxID=2763658 RepID=A0A926DZ02_9FIRM|nr:hypothetical protein [Ligaoa zhengdingensis]MBC8546059.1 hypothetical protein [Ligaoa zhengdingensis]